VKGRIAIISSLQARGDLLAMALAQRGFSAEPISWDDIFVSEQRRSDLYIACSDDSRWIAGLNLIRAAEPRMLALSLAERATPLTYALAFDAGSLGVLSLEWPVDDILDAVCRLLDGKPALDPRVLLNNIARGGRERQIRRDLERRTSRLTDRERDILRCLAQGWRASDIAARLHITEKTSRNHVAAILEKLDAKSQLQAVLVAISAGVVEPGIDFALAARRTRERS
jgi:DNA-binding NarL/FixJ family response regulator